LHPSLAIDDFARSRSFANALRICCAPLTLSCLSKPVSPGVFSLSMRTAGPTTQVRALNNTNDLSMDVRLRIGALAVRQSRYNASIVQVRVVLHSNCETLLPVAVRNPQH
jgi:hypothetical protein